MAPDMGLASNSVSGAYTVGGRWMIAPSYPGSVTISAVRALIPLATGSVTEHWQCGIWSIDGTLQDSIGKTQTGARAVWRFPMGYVVAPRQQFVVGFWRDDNAPTGGLATGNVPTAYPNPITLTRESLPNAPLVELVDFLACIWPSGFSLGQGVMPATVDGGTACRIAHDVEAVPITGTLLP